MSIESLERTPPMSIDSSITMAGSDSGGSYSPPPPPPKKPRVVEGRSLGVDDDSDCDMPTLGEEIVDDVALPQEQEEDADHGTSRRRIKLCLPSPSELSDEKEILLKNRNLCCELQVPTYKDAELTTQLEDLVKASRILHLNKIELYFVEDGEIGPFSPRNELESLNAVLSLINSALPNAKIEEKKVLASLKSSICGKIDEVASEYMDEETFKEYDKLGNELLKWGRCHGMKAKLNITCCSETGKGAEASEDIGIGDTVLEVPYSCIVWEDIVKKSDMYDDMKKNDLSSKEMFLLWCMNEKHNLVSEHKEYFQMLPKEFKTGLSFSYDGIQELSTATPLGHELVEIEQCLQLQFDVLYSTFSWIREKYTFENYRWAYQLLDTNGMEVVYDAKTKLCLVPVSEFFNHSLCPHILHHETVERGSVDYGSVDHKSMFLIFRASRPCRKGEQCYISYGNLSGHELIKSYGFLPKGLNPYDVLYLDWDWLIDNVPTTEHSDDFSWTTLMVRQLAFSRTHKFPARLVDHLYAKFCVAKDHKPEDIVPIIDALKKLEIKLERMGMLFRSLRYRSKQTEVGWDFKLAWEYHNLMEELLCAASTYCFNTLEELGRKCGRFNPDDRLLIPINKMGATFENVLALRGFPLQSGERTTHTHSGVELLEVVSS